MLIVTKRPWEFFGPHFKLTKGVNRVEKIPPRLLRHLQRAAERGEIEILDDDAIKPDPPAQPAPVVPEDSAPTTTEAGDAAPSGEATTEAEETTSEGTEADSASTCVPGDEDPAEPAEPAADAPATEPRDQHRGGRGKRR